MTAAGFGRVLTMSPPIVTDMRAYAGKVPHTISRVRVRRVIVSKVIVSRVKVIVNQ